MVVDGVLMKLFNLKFILLSLIQRRDHLIFLFQIGYQIKKAIVNIKNKDEKCFLWCILRYLHPKDSHEERLTDLKKYEFSLNTKGITFPMKLKDISKFEKLNPTISGINVFSVNENKKFYPLKMAERDCLNTIDLFLYEEDGVSLFTN